MARDFTLDKYTELCEALRSNYTIVRVQDYLADTDIQNTEFVAILRHDVDKHPQRSLDMAHLENALGFTSTYYFRTVPGIYDPQKMKEIQAMGHEVGYHYEVLDKTQGKKEDALILFNKEIKEMRVIVDVQTACMHGSPLKSWRNLDIWNNANPVDYGLLGEPYLSIDYNKVIYYTDTGRRWDGEKCSVDDHVQQRKVEIARTTDDLINIITKKTYPQMLIQTHPQRWVGGSAWVKELISQNVKNVGKRMLK